MNTGQINKSKDLDRYSIIPNDIVQNKNISMEAKALIVYLLSLPSNWIIYKTELPKNFKEGKYTVFKAFNELVDLGYIVKVAIFNGNLKSGYNYMVYSEPVDNKGFSRDSDSRHSEPRKSETRTSEDQQLQNKHDTNKTNKKEIFSFNDFWKLYPNKNAKTKCEEKWNKLKDDEKLKIKETIQVFIKHKPFESYNHPNPLTYLNQKRWEDEINIETSFVSENELEVEMKQKYSEHQIREAISYVSAGWGIPEWFDEKYYDLIK